MDVKNIDVKTAVTGLVLLSLFLIVYFFILPSQIEEPPAAPLALSPSLFCQVSTGLLILLSLILTLTGVFGGKKSVIGEGTSVSKAEEIDHKKVCVTIGVTILYLFMFETIGYFVSTAALMLFLTVYYGNRKWAHVLSIIVIILAFIFFLFVMGLKVALPEGMMI
jgi:putative tricarboxylic transport membrane protein